MSFTNEEMVKSLTSLIDETLEEIEEIKKSKFAASEIKIGDDSGLCGKGKNGSLETKKKEDEDEDEKDEDEDMDKGENEKADQDAGKFAQAPTVAKGENEKADQDAGKFAQSSTVSKKDEDEDEKDEDEKEDFKEMKKSIDENETLMKSYVDLKMESLDEKLEKMALAIQTLANSPVSRRTVPAGVAPLHKSAHEIEPMSKSTIADKLFELKKSGTEVNSTDIFNVETGSLAAANEIATRYGLK